MYKTAYDHGSGGGSIFCPQRHPAFHATSLRYTTYTTTLPLHNPKRPAYDPYCHLDLRNMSSSSSSSTPKCTGKATSENERCPSCRKKGPHTLSSHPKTVPTALKRQDAAIGSSLKGMKATAADAGSLSDMMGARLS